MQIDERQKARVRLPSHPPGVQQHRQPEPVNLVRVIGVAERYQPAGILHAVHLRAQRRFRVVDAVLVAAVLFRHNLAPASQWNKSRRRFWTMTTLHFIRIGNSGVGDSLVIDVIVSHDWRQGPASAKNDRWRSKIAKKVPSKITKTPKKYRSRFKKLPIRRYLSVLLVRPVASMGH